MKYIENYLIGRQPIFDQQLKVIGYELLYRTEESLDKASILNSDQATSEVIISSILDMGLERLLGQQMAFINLTRCFISGLINVPFGPDQVVLEMLEDIEPTEEIIKGLRELHKQGYAIALDDFNYTEKHRELLEIAHIVKLDVMGLEPEEIASQVERLKGSKVKLLAEKIETQEQLQYCQSLGFEYFQGYFLCKPELIKGRRLPANRVAIINLILKLQDRDTEIAQLEEMIQQEISLSYRLLRLINSAAFCLNREVKSIKHAITILGLQVIRDWAHLLLLSQIENTNPELIWRALFRAKMCEGIGCCTQPEMDDQFYTVGLFSVLDALMGLPLPELLEALPLEQEVKDALLGRGNSELTRTLNLVVAYDRAEWHKVKHPKLTNSQIRKIYIDALHDTDAKIRHLRS